MEKRSSIARLEFRFTRNRFVLNRRKKEKEEKKKEATRTRTHGCFFRSVKFIEPFLLLWWINHRVPFNDRKYIIFDRDS